MVKLDYPKRESLCSPAAFKAKPYTSTDMGLSTPVPEKKEKVASLARTKFSVVLCLVQSLVARRLSVTCY